MVLAGSLGVADCAAFLWLVENTASPPVPVGVVLLVSTMVLLVGPWAWLAVRRLDDAVVAGRIVRRVLATVGALVGVSVLAAVTLDPSEESGALPLLMLAILAAGVVALVGVVVGPWLYLLTRTVTRERAARVRAEERADLANHLHDSVLQTLTLIQKRAEGDGEVARLARSSERELRQWLYGGPPAGDDDLAGALAGAAAGVEDRFGLSVELVTVGTCPSDARTQALVGAVTEALTNAAKQPVSLGCRCSPRWTTPRWR
jgi:signal transduction histidine kinase